MLGWYIFCVHFTFGGSCGKFWFIAKEKWKRPPLYMPSSGSIVRVKLRMSLGSGNSVRHVLLASSSSRSSWLD